MPWPRAAQRVLIAVAALLLALSVALARRAATTPAAVPVADDPKMEVRLDLNAATAEDLETLPGVGAAIAARIVAHREARGPFRDPRELAAVPGVGGALAGRLAGFVTVDAAGAAGAGLRSPGR